jgi:hypothetical protein
MHWPYGACPQALHPVPAKPALTITVLSTDLAAIIIIIKVNKI